MSSYKDSGLDHLGTFKAFETNQRAKTEHMPILESQSEPIELFRESFDLCPFIFSHRLCDHPLFSISALKELTEKWAAKENDPGFFRISNSAQGLKWGSREFKHAVRDALENLETSRLRLKLSAVHLEPAYQQVLDECTQ